MARYFRAKHDLFGGTVVHWLALLPPGYNSWSYQGLSVWGLHALPVLAWVPFWCSGFFPQSKYIKVSLTDNSKFSTGVSVHGSAL